jgi:4-hydroxyphenylpyruvate dioxygenase
VARPVGLTAIDHIAANVGWNELRRWIDFYTDVLGFSVHRHPNEDDALIENSPSLSRAVTYGNGRITFPINEPCAVPRRGKSRIERYLESYHGPGVQRIVLATENIIDTVARMRRQGVDFLSVPHSYYGQLRARVGRIDESMEALERLGILVDRDDSGYLLQAVTRPVEDRPTLFFEVVQRKGCRGFSEDSFTALTEATELEMEAIRDRSTRKC